jgi:putative polyhydroxyalkanoate system protein
MATIDVKRAHTLTEEEAKKRIESLLKKLEDKLGLRWHWDGATKARFDVPSGAIKGASGTIKSEPNQVHLEVDLPFALRSLKGDIEKKIKNEMDALIH